MKRSSILYAMAVSLVVVSPLAADDFGGDLRLGMDATETELAAFGRYVEALNGSGDAVLAHLAVPAAEARRAVVERDVEAFIAARAIHEYRLQTLPDDRLDAVRALRHRVAEPGQGPTLGDVQVSEVNVFYGCGSELDCDDGSTISCTCGNSYGSCDYNPNGNSWGGTVSCDCAGGSFDVSKSCPFDGGDCSLGCRQECGLTGGICVNGTCICF